MKLQQRYGSSLFYLFPLIPLVLVTTVSDIYWGLWKYTFSLSSPRPFLDLELVTSNVDCHIANPQLLVSELTCDPGNRAFNYPEFMIDLASILRVGSSFNFALGVFFQFLFIGTLYFLVCLFGWKLQPKLAKLFLILLASVSPPVFFVLERGNTDSIVFVLTVLALH
jgi:hypothetical protein